MTATDSPSSPTATAEWVALRCSDEDDVAPFRRSDDDDEEGVVVLGALPSAGVPSSTADMTLVFLGAAATADAATER